MTSKFLKNWICVGIDLFVITRALKQTHGRWSTLSMGSDCAWIASIAVECSSSRFFPVESSVLLLAASRLLALNPAAAAAAAADAAAEDLAGLLPFSSASSLAACNTKHN